MNYVYKYIIFYIYITISKILNKYNSMKKLSYKLNKTYVTI